MELHMGSDLDGMASKRSSHTYVDEMAHRQDGPSKVASNSYRSRRNSSSTPMEEVLQVPREAEEEDMRNGQVLPDAAPASRAPTNVVSGGDLLVTNASRASDMTVSPLQSFSDRANGRPSIPISGRPANFGIVVPGVYRSSYPKTEDFGFLQNLKLKTVVTLVKRDEIDHDLESFVNANGIRQVVINMKGTKKEAIPLSTMKSILRLVLEQRNHPLLLHCNHGKHRTGCVVAVVRKLSGWELDTVLDEYKAYATPKIRECDVYYITSFQSQPVIATAVTSLQRYDDNMPARFNPTQIRTFLRTFLFSTLVMTIWLVSGSHIVSIQDRMPS